MEVDPFDIVIDIIGLLCYEIDKGPMRVMQPKDRLCLKPIWGLVRRYDEWIGLCHDHVNRSPTGLHRVIPVYKYVEKRLNRGTMGEALEFQS